MAAALIAALTFRDSMVAADQAAPPQQASTPRASASESDNAEARRSPAPTLYVGEGADRVKTFEVGWTDDVRTAVARACGESSSTVSPQFARDVDLMVCGVAGRSNAHDRHRGGRRGPAKRVDVAPGDDPRERAPSRAASSRAPSSRGTSRGVVRARREGRGGREGFATPLWNDLVAADRGRNSPSMARTRTFVQVGPTAADPNAPSAQPDRARPKRSSRVAGRRRRNLPLLSSSWRRTARMRPDRVPGASTPRCAGGRRRSTWTRRILRPRRPRSTGRRRTPPPSHRCGASILRFADASTRLTELARRSPSHFHSRDGAATSHRGCAPRRHPPARQVARRRCSRKATPGSAAGPCLAGPSTCRRPIFGASSRTRYASEVSDAARGTPLERFGTATRGRPGARCSIAMAELPRLRHRERRSRSPVALAEQASARKVRNVASAIALPSACTWTPAPRSRRRRIQGCRARTNGIVPHAARPPRPFPTSVALHVVHLPLRVGRVARRWFRFATLSS